MQAGLEIQKITEQLVSLYAPHKLFLFGSQAKNAASDKSDIDLCVVTDTANKRKLLTDMYLNIESNKPFDLLLYTPNEWETSVSDRTSFAHAINEKGVVLYVRQHEI